MRRAGTISSSAHGGTADGARGVVLEFDAHGFSGCGIAGFFENLAPVRVEHGEGETFEPVRIRAVVFTAIPHGDGGDRLRRFQVELPPWILLVFIRVRLRAGGESSVRVPVHRALGLAAARGAGLLRSAGARDVSPVHEDLHLGEGERAFAR